MKVGSLFSGIGGFDLGFERCGFETSWVVEQDPFCQFVLAKNFPRAQRHSDVRHVGRYNLSPVDIVCGGFPCQDISINNPKAKGLDGDRSGLWSEYARIVGELRPRYVVIENSPQLASKGLERVLRDLAVFGYDAEWHRLGASPIGAPHHRARLWVVAYTDCIGQERQGREHGLLTQKSWSEWVAKSGKSDWWTVEPEPQRVDDGFPNRLDKDWTRRVQASGNALVPQIAQWIGECIAANESDTVRTDAV